MFRSSLLVGGVSGSTSPQAVQNRRLNSAQKHDFFTASFFLIKTSILMHLLYKFFTQLNHQLFSEITSVVVRLFHTMNTPYYNYY